MPNNMPVLFPYCNRQWRVAGREAVTVYSVVIPPLMFGTSEIPDKRHCGLEKCEVCHFRQNDSFLIEEIFTRDPSNVTFICKTKNCAIEYYIVGLKIDAKKHTLTIKCIRVHVHAYASVRLYLGCLVLRVSTGWCAACKVFTGFAILVLAC